MPISGFSTGMNSCYHSPCDRIDQVSAKTQVSSTNAIIATTWELITR